MYKTKIKSESDERLTGRREIKRGDDGKKKTQGVRETE